MVDSRFFSSSKPLKYKSPQICKMNGFILSKNITWLEAPLDYLTLNEFIEYTNEKSRRKGKPNSN